MDFLQGRDLTPITDKLWKKFYERQFGKESTTTVIERMRQKRVAFRWIQLYEVAFLLLLFACNCFDI